MTTLTEEQVDVLHHYKELLTSIEEGFEYILASFSDYSKTEGDVILIDIFAAFNQVIQVNADLQVLFKKDAHMVTAIEDFEEVVSAAEKLDGLFGKSHEKQLVVQHTLYPAFKSWFSKIVPLLISKIQQ